MEVDEKLIHAVQKREAIYNIRNLNYRNNIFRMQMWQEVANEINVDIDICQKRWKSLRRKFSEEWQKRKMPSGAGTSAKKKTWVYFTMLLFLKPFVDSRDTTTSICDQSEESVSEFEFSNDTTEHVFSPTFSEDDINLDTQQTEPRLETQQFYSEIPQVTKILRTPSKAPSNQSTSSRGSSLTQKRKRIETLVEAELKKPELDEVQQFLLSLAPMLRNMDPVARLETQIDIQNVILKKIKEKSALL